MSDRRSEDDRLIRYLLGDALPDAEQNAIEESYFTDNSFFERVLAIEDDLIDSHIQGRLSDNEKALFEKHFLASDRRRERWEAQQAIASYFRSRAEPAGSVNATPRFVRSLKPAAVLLLAVPALALIVGLSILGLQNRTLYRQNANLRSRLTALEEQPPRTPAVATFVLEPERLRSGAGEQLRIAADNRWVSLRVELPRFALAYPSFSAELSTADGDEIWRQNGFNRIGSSIDIDLSVSALKRGDYVLSVSAVEGKGEVKLPSYQFRIER